ncbi:MAG TPA: PEP-CTERM sorting domain-containing protein [Terriglobia bacterium]|nr:PEP-CTERM sorting domain-containing protein [Terriglobia bacterium]
MRNKVFSLLSAAVLVLALGSMAKADTYDLTQQNGGLGSYSPASDYATVTLVLNGGTLGDGSTCAAGAGGVCIDFQATSGWMFHNAGVGWNQNVTTGSISSESVTTCTAIGGATCTIPGGSGNFDGFGFMTNSVTGGSGSSTGLTDIVITIAGTGLNLADFENANSKDNTTFSAQLSPFPNPNGGCTGFIGDTGSTTGFNGNGTGTNGCGGSSGTVPEPGSLALFGTGILGMAGYLRRKLLA